MTVTDPIPGHGEIPKPWDGKPPPHYRTEWDEPEPEFDDYGPPMGPPPRGPNRWVLAGIAAAVVVIVGAGVTLWWFGVGPGSPNAANAADQRATTAPATTTTPARPATSSVPDTASAYDVGSCFAEQNGTGPKTVELNPVPCGGNDAVFVINAVEPTTTACDSGPGSADFHDHGYEVPDETANVTYCASLVVPAKACFVLGAGMPIERTSCGSGPDVVQVLAIESAPAAQDACTDKTKPDVWFYQAPDSGQFACVSRPAASTPTSTTTTAPTSAR